MKLVVLVIIEIRTRIMLTKRILTSGACYELYGTDDNAELVYSQIRFTFNSVHLCRQTEVLCILEYETKPTRTNNVYSSVNKC